ncbi:Arginase/deacetylase [Aspergillus brunneoviolaceus CBS 621.78]|uniref:Arginase/deacetylase n=1 Tax=Aspergillus brunneoviolaceus CBS 621.78 TaxID=1450534 RepID=A0ACD1G051_9EURO|nr:Arginase/deacetylase [Aspergillus brunneoviolaceus CBS 621.78]RAH42605.1 Arginase/deacetylase [Aspergillus brunneoviolaceus CBS 621.78]
MTGWAKIGSRKPRKIEKRDHVRLLSLALPALRALHNTWDKVAFLQFYSHLDTWDPKQLGWLHEVLWAHEKGLVVDHSIMHLSSRSMLFEKHYNVENNARCGSTAIRARQIDEGVDTVQDRPVYISIDTGVLDPAFAPATGTIEPGGWTTHELLQILNGLSHADIKIIGADIVEFAPAYDNRAETTGLAVAQIAYELLQWMICVPVKPAGPLILECLYA